VENIYLAFIVVLFLLAISDLIVGVSNDAVNFLNSAVGAKAAPFKWVMFVAALGVLVGATFSGGMMEIARSGIFHPDKFYFSDIMLIFLAVMITDVILLDTFNSLGLPTSTTVSIVFELLGASVAVAYMKISNGAEPHLISEYINSGKALAIISGILLSVVIAFSVGALIQYITRLLFSFNYEKRFKYYGGIFGGLAITAIVYFILIKGAKDAAFMTKDAYTWITTHQPLIIAGSLVGFTALLYLLNFLFKLNILKVVVLAGTFALAMAFAANDLVNFIGVPLAGYESYKTLLATQGADPEFFTMGSLKDAIQTPLYFLILAGFVMVITLYTSRKAKTVIKTSVDLSRQSGGEERFGSSPLSRSIVRASINVSDSLSRFVPEYLKEKALKQFEPLKIDKEDKNPPAFDLLRASINLVVSSALIAMGTSLKLPLSTTYVTFMVAMGTSLSDGAWDRDSAVYRITGVFSVIGGWFFTAFSAFFVSFLLGLFFYFGGVYAIGIMIALSIFLVYRTHKMHVKMELKREESSKELEEMDADNILESCTNNVNNILSQTQFEFKKTISGLTEENIKTLKKTLKNVEKLTQKAKERKNSVTIVIGKLKDDAIESGHFYVQALDYAREILHSLNFIVTPTFDHVNNKHKSLSEPQLSELKLLSQHLGNYFTHISTDIGDKNFNNQEALAAEQQKVLGLIDLFRKNEVKRIKKDSNSTRNTLLFLTILQESKNLLLFAFNLYKAQRDFLGYYLSKQKIEK